MLLEDLLKLTQLGAKKPILFWLDEYREISLELQEKLTEIHDKMKEESNVKNNLQHLIELLKKEIPNEFEIAQALLHVAEVFQEVPEEQKQIVQNFVQTGKTFYDRSQLFHLFANERAMVSKHLAPEEKVAKDKRLFENEGMMYCLEYYLVLYKTIQNAPTEGEKRKYIESTTIVVELGEIPGLWIDFSRDEVLSKFILKIMNDDVRRTLIEAYYTLKEELMKINIHCDKQGNCSCDYEHTDLNTVITSFKTFIQILIQAFQTIGIETLGSVFFRPYGDKPRLENINL